MAKRIRIKIDKTGVEKIEAIGFTGQECLSATHAYEAGLLNKRDAPTGDMYQGDEQIISVGT